MWKASKNCWAVSSRLKCRGLFYAVREVGTGRLFLASPEKGREYTFESARSLPTARWRSLILFSMGAVLWALGVLAGGGAAEVLPGKPSVITPAVMLIVALLAAAVNLFILFKRVKRL